MSKSGRTPLVIINDVKNVANMRKYQKSKLIKQVEEVVLQRYKDHMSEGTVCTGLGAKGKTSSKHLQLGRYDILSVYNVNSNLVFELEKQIPLKGITGVQPTVPEEFQPMLKKGAMKVARPLFFTILSTDNDPMYFAANLAEDYVAWTDGLRKLLNQDMTNPETAAEIEELTAVAIEMQLLEIDLTKLPEGFDVRQAPPIPPLPPLANYSNDFFLAAQSASDGASAMGRLQEEFASAQKKQGLLRDHKALPGLPSGPTQSAADRARLMLALMDNDSDDEDGDEED